MTTPHAVNHQTRQQLDELDALLQRMLSLPATEADEQKAVKPIPAAARVPVPLPPAPPVMTVRETPSAITPASSTPQVQNWRVELPNPVQPEPIPNPAFAGWSNPVATPPATTPAAANPSVASIPNPPSTMVFGAGNAIAPVAPSPVAATPAAISSPIPVNSPSAPMPVSPVQPVQISEPIPMASVVEDDPSLPIWAWPFWGLNLIYDLSTYLLGPLTSWLSAPVTKNILGWTGVLLMLLSLGFGLSLWLGLDWTTQLVK